MLLLNSPRFGAGAFTPAIIASLTNWWDAQDDTTITQTTSVTLWTDKKGTADFTNTGTGPLKTTFQEGQMLAFNSAGFTGLEVSSAEMDPASGDRTYIIAYKSFNRSLDTLFAKDDTVGTDEFSIKVGRTVSNNFGSLSVRLDDGTTGTTVEDTVYDYQDGQLRIAAVTFDATANEVKLYGDDFSTPKATDLSYNPGAISPNDKFTLGRNVGGGADLDGAIGEICCFDEVLSAENMALMETYLRERWELATSSIDEGLPAVGTLVGHWSTYDSGDYTLSSGEVTQLDDISTNSNHLVNGAPTKAIGPDLADVDGQKWMRFTGNELLHVTAADMDPAAGDWSMVVVFRATGKATMSPAGKLGANDPHYLLNLNSSTENLLAQFRDNGTGAGPVLLTDDTSENYSDGTKRIAVVSYDDSLNLLQMYGRSSRQHVDSDNTNAQGSVDPSNPFYVGSFRDTSNYWVGDICEVLVYTSDLVESQLDALYHYLKRKWGFYDAFDERLPASVNAPEGWWSSYNPSDLTVVSGEVTELRDRSGNGRDFTPGGGTGPTLTVAAERDWLTFESATPTVLRMVPDTINPDAGDFTMVVVYKTSDSSAEGIISKKTTAGTDVWGFRKGDTASKITAELDDGTTGLTLADPTSIDDGTARLACLVYDDSADDAWMFANDPLTANAVDSDLAYVSGAISPTSDMFLGSWDGSEDYNGQIAEVLIYKAALTEEQRTDLFAYLSLKWGIA